VQALANHRLDSLGVVALVALRKLDEYQTADMHRRLKRFEVQERGVDAAELIHAFAFQLNSGRANQLGPL